MLMNFLNTLRNDPKAKELIQNMPLPKNDEETLGAYEENAKILGYDISKEDILNSIKTVG